MEILFMDTENSKTTDSNRFRLYFTNKLDPRGNKTMSLSNLSIYYKWKNIKEEYKNNKFNLSEPTWDETFDLPDGSHTIEDIQDYFLWVIKKHETDVKSSEESPIPIYPNRIENRIVFKIRNNHLQNSKLLYTFVPSDDFGKLLFIEPNVLKQSKTTDSVLDCIEVWFTDRNNRPLQIEDDVSLSLIVQNA